MKIRTLLLLGLILLTSCNSTGHKPIYNNFKNDLDRENLAGKVRIIEEYKTIELDSKAEPTKEFVKEYTKTGNLASMKKYDVFGKQIYSTQNIYNKKRLKIKAFTEDINMATKSVEEYKYKNDNLSYARVFVNDTLKYESYLEYDKNGHLTRQIEIQIKETPSKMNDTTLNTLTYTFDKSGNVISKKNVQTTKNDSYNYSNNYKYDKKNNIIETDSHFDIFGSLKVVNVYDSKDRIEKSIEYGEKQTQKKISKDRNKKSNDFEDKQIQKEIFYDKSYDETLIRFYRDGALEREMKYEYEFDTKGNWIKRKAYIKNSSAHSDEFKFIYLETRKILYYE